MGSGRVTDTVHIVDEEPDWMIAEREAAADAAVRNGHDPGQPLTPLARIEAAVYGTEALKAMPPANPLVDGLLDLDSLALIYGSSGASKTFLAVDLALHVATGSWWNGCAVKPGPVVYVAAEGARGLGRRITAWQHHHQVYDLERHHPIWWVTMPINLHNASWAGTFAEFCEARTPALVVIDTLARCMAGGDENSAKDAGVVIDHLDRIKRRTGACVAPVHHSGKDASSGARGSSALRAAVDTELEVSSTDDIVTLKITKQKDHVEGNPRRLARIPVADSCVLTPDRGQTATTGLKSSHQHALDTLHAITIPGGVSSTAWEAAATDRESRDRIGRSTFFEARATLLALGYVQNLGTDKQTRYAPITPGQEPTTHE